MKKTFLLLILFLYANLGHAKFASSSIWASLAIPAVAGAYSIYIEDYQGARQLVYSELLAGQAAALLNVSVHRTRPNGRSDNSFPQGEAAIGFAAASYFQHRYDLLSSVPFYVAATTISLERINVKENFWSDAVVGAAMGYVSAALFTKGYPVSLECDPSTRYCGVKLYYKY